MGFVGVFFFGCCEVVDVCLVVWFECGDGCVLVVVGFVVEVESCYEW